MELKTNYCTITLPLVMLFIIIIKNWEYELVFYVKTFIHIYQAKKNP